MRKSILSILGIMFIMLCTGLVIADPWVTFGDTATSRTNIAMGSGFTFTSPGTVTAEQLTSTDDANIAGDLTVVGIGTFTGGTINSGVYDGDLRLAANHSLYSTLGSGGIDWSNATGIWKMPTGQGTIGGATDFNDAITCRDVTLDANKNLSMSGTGTVTTGTGTVDINGAATTKGITQDAGSSLAQSGASGITVGTTGITAVSSPLNLLENTVFAKTISIAVNASTTVDTTLTSSSTKTVYGVDAHSANVTLTLPDAATVSGRTYKIGTNVDPGSYYVKITATGGDKLGGAGGATTLMTTSGAAGISLVSDGTLYLIDGAYGTWV